MHPSSIGRAGVLVLAAMLAGEGTGFTRDAGGILTGQVVDAQTGSPIAGARVTLSPSGRSARSGADGHYLVASVAAGTYAVRCAKAGYLSDTTRGLAMAAGARITHTCRLRRARHTRDDLDAKEKTPAAPPVARPTPDVTTAHVGRVYAYRKREAYAAGTAATRSPVVAGPAPSTQAGWDGAERPSREGYSVRDENPFVGPSVHPLSTFSIDVDTAGYANLRRFIERQRQLPPSDAVKIEEMVNYFPYSYREPTGKAPFAVNTEMSAAPWNPAHQLVRIGLQARRMNRSKLPASNLTFLIDVSGSMDEPDKLPLLKSALSLLVRELRPKDRVAIVVYAGAAGLVLPSTDGRHKDQILAALDQLQAGGSTAGAAGIQLAYQVARQNFIRGGNNRVILATDGDFNVGASSDAELVRMIEKKRQQGVFLTVLGFGTGNYQDAKMEQLADKGNGNHAYIDSISEARKVLVSEMGGTLFTVAKDVKLQIEFNPALVKGYRLIGYENRMLRAEDFNNDKKDAGELGAGHSVTAFYEIIPAGSKEKVDGVDPLKYQQAQKSAASGSSELMTVKLRYKQPSGDKSSLMVRAIQNHPAELASTSVDFRFATSVAELGLILRASKHKGHASYRQLIARARGALGPDPGGYRHAFLTLALAAEKLGAPPQTIAH